ncbi:cation:proton antiporter [Aeromicrobium piscarium]|uniref:Sodium:proton antiporter n=1 Tax=Aeromicrobium piscarium TaxID=2590901 RepID=A0A554S898_9ACTN|nr:cation:proton antiporter [Aeromicrobium piscarium]TSD62589.1 sodium:proton antiporter [Aeromicrobium piscarium]
MELTLIVVVALLVIVAVHAVAGRVGVAAPLVLVLVGIGVSLLPAVPDIEIEPEWILGVVLPPLLYAAAVRVPTMDFRRDFKVISGLSVVLVVISSVVIGWVISMLIPGIGLATGIALGAIVSPTDAVATSIVRKARVSPRIVTVLEGESMLNDASALVLLRSAIAATGASVSLWGVVGDFLYAVAVAVVIGFVVGHLNLAVRAKLGDPTAGVAITIVAPFAAYLPAEHLHASGLVAAVVAGLVAGHGTPRRLTAQDRATERAVWGTLEFVLESAVFLLIGLELEAIVRDVQDHHGNPWQALVYASVVVALVLVLRSGFVGPLIWWMSRRQRRFPELRERINEAQGRVAAAPDHPRSKRMGWVLNQKLADIDYFTEAQFGRRAAVVLVWAGMRGAVTLAAAQTLPADTPQRSLLVLIAFVVAVGTLIIQGGTLPWLVGRLGLSGGDPGATERERDELRAHLRTTSRAWLDEQERLDDSVLDDAMIERLRRMMEAQESAEPAFDIAQVRRMRLALIDSDRAELLRLSEQGTFSSQVIEEQLNRLDAEQIGLELRDHEDG